MCDTHERVVSVDALFLSHAHSDVHRVIIFESSRVITTECAAPLVCRLPQLVLLLHGFLLPPLHILELRLRALEQRLKLGVAQVHLQIAKLVTYAHLADNTGVRAAAAASWATRVCAVLCACAGARVTYLLVGRVNFGASRAGHEVVVRDDVVEGQKLARVVHRQRHRNRLCRRLRLRLLRRHLAFRLRLRSLPVQPKAAVSAQAFARSRR